MQNTNPKVDGFLRKAKTWREEMQALRAIVLASGLTEELKWRQPCYTLNNGNVLIISAFKHYAALLFFKGALLEDKHQLLKKPGENTQSGRRMEFTALEQIITLEPILKDYIRQAIKVEKAGLAVKKKPIGEHSVPQELTRKFAEMPRLKKAFDQLTPGRRRAYLLHFCAAKQSKTRTLRIQRCVERILNGKGLTD